MSTHIRLGDKRIELRSKASLGEARRVLDEVTRENVRALDGKPGFFFADPYDSLVLHDDSGLR